MRFAELFEQPGHGFLNFVGDLVNEEWRGYRRAFALREIEALRSGRTLKDDDRSRIARSIACSTAPTLANILVFHRRWRGQANS